MAKPKQIEDPLDLHALIEFLNFETFVKFNPITDLAQRRLMLLLAASGRRMQDSEIESLKNDLVGAVDYLFTGNTDRYISEIHGYQPSNLAERLEALLHKIDQVSPPDSYYYRVGTARSHDDAPVVEIDGNRLVIKKISYSSPRAALYQILGDALRYDRVWRLGKCPECGRFFFKRTRRRNYCSPDCEPSSNKQRAAAGYFKKTHEKHAKANTIQVRKREVEAVIKTFQAFLDKACSRKPTDQMAVGAIVRQLGSWRTVTPWCGKRATDVWKSLDAKTRETVRSYCASLSAK